MIDGQWLKKKEKGEIITKNYSGSIGVTKCIEVFPIQRENKNVLLVRFYSLGSHAPNYWKILEKDSNYLFYYNEKDKSIIENYLKKYDVKTQQMLLDYLKIYTDRDDPSSRNLQLIDEK